MRGRAILVRLTAAAFLADLALYLVMTGAPYKALALGAGPLALGFVPVARALPYTLTTVWAGGLTEGAERLRIARGTLLAGGAAILALAAVPSLPWLYLCLGVLGLMLAFFWPAVQATFADAASHGAVSGNLGWFNIGWSTGKAAGFLAGGFLLSGLGFGAVFGVAAGAILGVAVLVATLARRPLRAPPAAQDRAGPGESPVPGEGVLLSPPASAPLHPRAGAFRLAAWIGNAVAFGIGAVLNTHYPDWLEAHGRGEALFGSYLGVIFGAQTVTFGLLARSARWHYRAPPLLLAQAPLVLVLLLLPRLDHPAAILATAPGVGIGLGVSYYASLFYSVHAPRSRGRNAGMHEALLGLGAMALPVLGGWVAGREGRLDAPYLVAALVGLFTLLVQGWILRTGGGDAAVPERA